MDDIWRPKLSDGGEVKYWPNSRGYDQLDFSTPLY